MIVSFHTKQLHDCCYVASVAEAELGSTHGEALRALIADAEALETAEELIELRTPDASVNSDDSLSVRIGAEWRARFVAVGQEFSRDVEGRAVWSSVRRLKLVALEPV
jgi:hypothetical protein